MRNYRYDEDPLLAACGISIDKQLSQVDGRVLEAPKVKLYSLLVYNYLTSHIFQIPNSLFNFLIGS